MRQGWIAGVALWLLTGAARAQEEATQALDDDAAAGERGRAQLAALCARAREQKPDPRPCELEERDRALGLEFRAVEVPGLRVLASGGDEEQKRVARALAAARTVFQELFGSQAAYPPGCTVYLLKSSEEKQAFFERHPALTAETRAWLEKLEGAGIPGTADWAYWEGDEEKRLDGTVRLALDWLFKSYGVTLEAQAWLHEGFGFYLTHALVDTRLTWFVPPRAGDPKKDARLGGLQTRLKDPETDWMLEARGAFAAKHKFDLEELFHLQAGELDSQDYLRIYALGAYLIEAQSSKLGTIVERVGALEDPQVVLQEALGFDLATLRQRLDHWLEGREALVARAEGRRTDAELLAAWKKLDAASKRALVAELRLRLSNLDTQQLRWIAALVKTVPSAPARAAEAPFYDPAKHAPGQVIPRKRLSAGDARVKKLWKQLEQEPDPRALRAAWRFDWGSGEPVPCGDPDDPETVFGNALHGIPPGLDLARALVLKDLDVASERAIHTALAHAYTDRDGNVYPGVTLYDMWASGTTIEMPDVDALGLIHDLLDEWKHWVAPVPGSQHEALYRVIGEFFQRARRSRELRETLADCFLSAHPVPRVGYESLETNLHALWALNASDPGQLSRALPDGKQWEGFLKGLVERSKKDFELYSLGKRRSAALKKDGEAVRAALVAALDAVAAASAGSESGDR